MPDRCGEVWEVKMHSKEPPHIILFCTLRGDGTYPRYYETFNLLTGSEQLVVEHAHYPFEKNRRWSRL